MQAVFVSFHAVRELISSLLPAKENGTLSTLDLQCDRV